MARRRDQAETPLARTAFGLASRCSRLRAPKPTPDRWRFRRFSLPKIDIVRGRRESFRPEGAHCGRFRVGRRLDPVRSSCRYCAIGMVWGLKAAGHLDTTDRSSSNASATNQWVSTFAKELSKWPCDDGGGNSGPETRPARSQWVLREIAKQADPFSFYFGTEGRTRTGTVLPPPDFESGASTCFATPARAVLCHSTNRCLTGVSCS